MWYCDQGICQLQEVRSIMLRNPIGNALIDQITIDKMHCFKLSIYNFCCYNIVSGT